MNYTKINADLWNEWVRKKCVWTLPISHDDFINAEKGDFSLYATPTKKIPADWIGDLKNKKVLGLAAGGGQQCPIFKALGADVTVFDFSDGQLDNERKVAERENYQINIVKGDMSKPFPFDDECFDLIFNPVSTTYISDVESLWQECYRVLKKDGKLITAIVNPALFIFEIINGQLIPSYSIPTTTLNANNVAYKDIQFSHSWTSQLGGQLKAGFMIQDLFEDHHINISNEEMKPAIIAKELTKYMPIYLVVLSLKK